MNSATSWPLVLVGIVWLAGGCATSGTGVTVEPFPGRPEARVRADSERCAEAASAQPEAARTRTYAACALAQGYRVTMPFRAGVEHARLTIGAPTGRPAAVIATDLAGCESAVSGSGAGDVVAGRYGGVLSSSDTTQVRPHSTDAPGLVNQLATCLGQRGYDTR